MNIETLLTKKIDEKKQGNILDIKTSIKGNKKLYIESYGCQMNFSAEIIEATEAKLIIEGEVPRAI